MASTLRVLAQVIHCGDGKTHPGIGKLSLKTGKISRNDLFFMKSGCFQVVGPASRALAFALTVYYQGTKPKTPKWHSDWTWGFLDWRSASWQLTNPIANHGES